MTLIQVLALKHVRDQMGSITVPQFDDQFAPIGPILRRDLIPEYMAEDLGFLIVTARGGQTIKLNEPVKTAIAGGST